MRNLLYYRNFAVVFCSCLIQKQNELWKQKNLIPST